MKKVAIYYEHGLSRNDGFPLYAFNLLKDKTLYPDIEAVHLIPNGDYKGYEDIDLHLWIDWGEDGLTDMLPYTVVWPKGKVAYFASDTHLGKDYRFARAKQADYVFFAQKQAVAEYKPIKHNKHVSWLPHGVEPRAFPNEPKAAKKYDVSFVGHLVSQERIDFLDVLFKEFPNFWFGRRWSRYVKDDGQVDDCADIFRKTKVVLNPPTKHEVNMRLSEICATGSFQLTERVLGAEELYKDKEHVVYYDTIPEAIALAHYYLTHDKERETIAAAGYKQAIAHNTYKQRLDTMLRVAGILE